MEGTEVQAAPTQDSAPAEQPEGQATEPVEAQAPTEEAPTIELQASSIRTSRRSSEANCQLEV